MPIRPAFTKPRLPHARITRAVWPILLALGTIRCSGDAVTDPPAPPVPTHLSFSVQPAAVIAGSVIAPAVQVRVQDDDGKTVTNSTAIVTVALAGGPEGAALGGTQSRAAVAGVVTFDDLTIDKAGAGYTLRATAVDLAGGTSVNFSVAAGAAARLAIAVQPTAATAGAAIAPAIQAIIQDAQGNTITSSTAAVTIAIVAGTGADGAVLAGTLVRPAAAGIATFTDLSIAKAGAGYALAATATGVASDTSDAFTVNPGAPTAVQFATHPTNVVAGAAFAPVVLAVVLDALGNVVTPSTATVTVAILGGTGTAGAALGGRLSRVPVAGVVTFNGITVDRAGTGYVLTATATGLASAASTPFDVASSSGTPTNIHLQSDVGDYIGQGRSYQYTQADAIITVSSGGRLFHVQVNGDEGWTGDFVVPNSLTQIEPGVYTGLTRYPFHNPAVGGLDWYGEGRGCNMLTGWFAVDQVLYLNGNLVLIDLRFEQHCEGGSSALYGTIHWAADDPSAPPGPVLPIPAGLWAPAAGSTPATGDFVHLVSDAADPIGLGQTLTYTPANATIGVTTPAGRLSITVSGWFGDFQAMVPLSELQPGYYPDLQRYPFHNPAKGGLTWFGQGRGCNTLAGWFVVDSVTYSGGALAAIDLRFEQYCEGFPGALHGAVHWGG